ncbi:MAG: hypothetical protein ABSG64_04570 [Solirubrobacteraceae bacterium]
MGETADERFGQAVPGKRGTGGAAPHEETPLSAVRRVIQELNETLASCTTEERRLLLESTAGDFFRKRGFELSDGYYIESFGDTVHGALRRVTLAEQPEPSLGYVWLAYSDVADGDAPPPPIAQLWRPDLG